MDQRSDPFNYFHGFDVAVLTADCRARMSGCRHRVQVVAWEPPRGAALASYYVAPTPAPGPARIGAEPCS